MMLFDFHDGRGHVPARKHQNGGGIVALTAKVANSVFLASDVVVFGYAEVRDNVRVTGRASIQGDLLPGDISTLIEDNVKIVGPVEIRGAVLLRDSAEIRGHVKMSGLVQVMHHSTVAGNVVLEGDVLVLDRSHISGNIRIVSSAKQIVVRGEDVISGDREIYATEEINLSRNTDKKGRRQKRETDVRANRLIAA